MRPNSMLRMLFASPLSKRDINIDIDIDIVVNLASGSILEV